MSPDLGFGIAIAMLVMIAVLKMMKAIAPIVTNILIAIAFCVAIYFAIHITPAKDKYGKAAKTLDKTSSQQRTNKPHRWFDIDTY